VGLKLLRGDVQILDVGHHDPVGIELRHGDRGAPVAGVLAVRASGEDVEVDAIPGDDLDLVLAVLALAVRAHAALVDLAHDRLELALASRVVLLQPLGNGLADLVDLLGIQRQGLSHDLTLFLW
jgi:hypothetical protein